MATVEERLAHLEGKIDLILESTRMNGKLLEGNGRPGVIEVAHDNTKALSSVEALASANAESISKLTKTVDKHVSSGRHVPNFFVSWEFVGIMGTGMLIAWPVLYVLYVVLIGLEHWGDVLLHTMGIQ